jgi:putative alpha-1,2-mannosidase
MRRPCPPLKKVFKIIESPATRAQYDLHKYEPSHHHEGLVLTHLFSGLGANTEMRLSGIMAPHESAASAKLVTTTHACRTIVQRVAF